MTVYKSIAILLPLFVCIFWVITYCLDSKSLSASKKQLAVFFLASLVLYGTHAVFFSNLYRLYVYIESLYIFFMLLVFPLFFRYIVSLTGRKPDKRVVFLQTIPAVGLATLSLITGFFMSAEQQLFYVQKALIDKDITQWGKYSLVDLKVLIFYGARIFYLGQIIYFSIKGICISVAYNRSVTNYYSDVEGKIIDWVRSAIIVILIAASVTVLFVFLGRGFFIRHGYLLLIPSLIYSSVLYYIGFKGSIQEEPIEFRADEANESDAGEHAEPVSPNEHLKKRLLALFEEAKIYTDPGLRIVNISEALGTNRTYISRLINEEFQMNFNEFVNRYRVQEAERLLTQDVTNNFTLEHIAEKSGFGSLNSFIRAFKELKGLTPGAYRRKLQE